MRIGIDLGGTKIEGIVLDGEGGERARLRVATPVGDYAGTIAAVTGLVARLEHSVGEALSVGVAIPGTLSAASGRVKNANSTWLIGRFLDRDLEAALNRPVRLANDANCFAVSEAADGAGAGAEVVFGVILGTGVGGGLVVRGRVLTGANGVAGEWGHNPLPWPGDRERPGPACYCGKQGCIEQFLCGPALARDYHARTGRSSGDGSLGGPTAVEVAGLARAGDPLATAALERYQQRLARALAMVINIVDPDVIVLGGGLSNVESLYGTVPRLWRDFVFSDRVDTRLKQARHGDSSGVRGAAWLWDDGRAR